MGSVHDIPMGLRAAYRRMHRQTGAWLAAEGVTADQFVLLSLLELEDGLTQQALVTKASSDPNTVRAMLLLLERNGLIARRRHPQDGRARLVTLTRKGREACSRISIRIGTLQARINNLFAPEEAKRLVEMLERIAAAMGPDSGDGAEEADLSQD